MAKTFATLLSLVGSAWLQTYEPMAVAGDRSSPSRTKPFGDKTLVFTIRAGGDGQTREIHAHVTMAYRTSRVRTDLVPIAIIEIMRDGYLVAYYLAKQQMEVAEWRPQPNAPVQKAYRYTFHYTDKGIPLALRLVVDVHKKMIITSEFEWSQHKGTLLSAHLVDRKRPPPSFQLQFTRRTHSKLRGKQRTIEIFLNRYRRPPENYHFTKNAKTPVSLGLPRHEYYALVEKFDSRGFIDSEIALQFLRRDDGDVIYEFVTQTHTYTLRFKEKHVEATRRRHGGKFTEELEYHPCPDHLSK